MSNRHSSPLEIKIGKYGATCLPDSPFGVDGGAMFHTVPKTLWQRKITPDSSNRVFTGLNCLLLQGEGKTILFDAGIGNKLSDKMQKIYGTDPNAKLLTMLYEKGLEPADIDTVVVTHLHFDHAGWCTTKAKDGSLAPTFPNARYIIQQKEWEVAHNPNELTRRSYMPENFDPLEEAGVIDLIDGDYDINSSIKIILTGGHSPGHQILKLISEDKTLLCPCELIPTTWHLRVPWVTSFDQEPATVLDLKRSLMQEASEKSWILFLTHDPSSFWGQLALISEGNYEWKPYLG